VFLFSLQALETHLNEFGIDNLTMVNIVSDRGSNFVKAFQDLDPLFCFGHRMNNVLKTSFFQHIKKKKKQPASTTTNDITVPSNNHTAPKINKDAVTTINDALSSEESSEDDEEYVPPSLLIVRKRKTKISKTRNDNQQLLRKVSIDDIPGEAKTVLSTLKQCKKLVKYIKKANIVKF
jgi:hypothetical protein